MVCGLSSSERVERVERPRNYKPENRPDELSPQRVGRFLAVAAVVVRWVLVAGGAVGAGRVDAGSDFVLSSASLWVDMRRWLLRYSWLYVSVVGSPGAWKS